MGFPRRDLVSVYPANAEIGNRRRANARFQANWEAATSAAHGRIRPVCRASKCDLRHTPLRQPGSMPFFFMTMAADGDVRNFANAFAASGFVAPVWIPLENMVIC